MAKLTKDAIKKILIKNFGMTMEALKDHTKKDLEAVYLEKLKEESSEEVAAEDAENKEKAAAIIEGKENADTNDEDTAAGDAHVRGDADTNADGEKKEEEEELVVTDEMKAAYIDEASPQFCGTFENPDLASPICNKECLSMFPDRFALCNAIAEQARISKEKSVKKARSNGNRSEMKNFVVGLITDGKYTRKQIIALYEQTYPQGAVSTCRTYLSDGLSERYNPFAHPVLENKESKIISFNTSVEAPGSRKKSEEAFAAKQEAAGK